MSFLALRHRVEHAAFVGFRGLVRLLPHRSARPFGRVIGEVTRLLDVPHRRVGLANLALALPELPAAERRRLLRRSYRHFGAALFDTLSSSRFDARDFCGRLSLEGWEHLQAAEARGRGLFVLSAHLGQWEIAAYPPGIYGGPLHVVGRPLDNPHLDRELAELRGRFGNRLIPKRGAARGALAVLKEGGRVGILVDQRVPKSQGIEVPFFGHPCTTSPLPARLSLGTGAPVVPVFGYPEPGGRWRVVVREPIYPPDDPPGRGAGREAAVAALTTEYLRATEAEIRPHPHLWLWTHRRWLR